MACLWRIPDKAPDAAAEEIVEPYIHPLATNTQEMVISNGNGNL